MIQKIFTTVVCFAIMVVFSPGMACSADTPAGPPAHQCKMDGKGCSCGKDCACEHCKTGKGRCQCRTKATSSGTQGNSSPAMMTVAGVFKVSYATDPAVIPLNAFHTWTLTVRNASGEPITDAVITVKGGMPLHGHGLPSEPRVTKNLGDGSYLIEGVKFMMPGEWEMTFTVKSGGKEDSATFAVTI